MVELKSFAYSKLWAAYEFFKSNATQVEIKNGIFFPLFFFLGI